MRRPYLRTLLAAGVAISVVGGAGAPAAVASSWFFDAPSAPVDLPVMRRPMELPVVRRLPYRHPKPKKLPAVATRVKGPLLIAISIADQRLTLFDDGVPIAHAPVSTGMAGHLTPMGVFSVIQKERYHRSNIYSGAPMPFMQRITWSGVAMHAGVLPGYPASHGCIRMPPDFAVKLYGMTRVGARVVITRHEVAPVDIEHAQLAALKQGEPLSRTGELKPAATGKGAVKVAEAAATTDATQSSVIDAAKPADAPAPADATAPADTVSSAARSDGAPPDAAASAAAAKIAAEPPAAQPPTAEPAASEPAASRPPAAEPPAAEPPTAEPPAAEAPAAFADAPHPNPNADPATGTTPAPEPTTAAVKPANAPVEQVPPADALPVTAALPIDEVFVPPSRPARALRAAPVSIFISRKEGRLYVRKGFDPLFSVPVSIAHPDQPIGTHVFTATDVKPDGVSLRWMALSVPTDAPKKAGPPVRAKAGRADRHHRAEPPARDTAGPPSPTAAQALDRINLSPELTAQLSALMSVGASLIISDQGLGPETGLETDFIVVTPVEKAARPRRRPVPVVSTARKSYRDAITFW